MQIITDPSMGLFPHPKEINLSCSCPDWADMCKHVAAVLYGIGARLDDKPEELFQLRQADYVELIAKAGTTSLTQPSADQSDQILADSDLSLLFGIDMGDTSQNVAPSNQQKLKKRKVANKPNKTACIPKVRVTKKATKKKVSGVIKKGDSTSKPKVQKVISKNALQSTKRQSNKNTLSHR